MQPLNDKKKQLLDRRKNYDPRRSAQNGATSRERTDVRSKSNLRQSDKSPVSRGVDKKGIEGSSLLKMSVLQDMKQKNIGSPIIPNKGVGSTLG